MGEKEQDTTMGGEARSGKATGRAFPETNVAQSDAEGGTATEEGERRQHGPGPMEATTVKSSKSNSSERQGAGVLSPDTDQPNDLNDEGGGILDEGPLSIQKQKTKSNQSNDRLEARPGIGHFGEGVG